MGDEHVNNRVLGYLLFDITHIDLEILRIYSQFFSEKLQCTLTHRPDLSSESFFWRRLYHQYYIEHPRDKIFPRADKSKESIILALDALQNKFHDTIY